jgi:hypothetical protein
MSQLQQFPSNSDRHVCLPNMYARRANCERYIYSVVDKHRDVVLVAYLFSLAGDF